ncbi:helix-turn-helix transcriptional regulator [Myxacorys almedinensis]|uniref:Helix-turn-helix domain-containing protein n=1 Tax=Myxacorys almedinensis A TaxID=2690445 RepID=A0A8J7Z7R4_9CYAN|nr:AraC family transcriptional regulator [Myxacorys almedinensis]NDJ17070.1 helix-turn-helix domain-containing protein [Myxacorys almedinensis A]
MTLILSQQAYDDLCYETAGQLHHPDIEDQFDQIYQFPQQLGCGFKQEIELREGILLRICDLRFHDRAAVKYLEREHCLGYHFHFSGEHQGKYHALGTKRYAFCGSGLAPEETICYLEHQPFLEVIICLEPDVLCSFVGNSEGQLPEALQSLVRRSDQEYYSRSGVATLPMQTIAQQILQCPYQGIAKRMYLESKVLELMSLLITQQIEIQTGEPQISLLRPDQIERLHYAKEILLHQLQNPPTLMQLARKVGLNECTLKRGFREVFGKTVYGYLRDYRMEQARSLLEAGDMNITEIARAIGFRDRSPFALAFRKHFGVNPKNYQKQQKNSV